MTPEILETAIAAVRLYAETHPRPPCVTQAQAAKMIGVSAQTMGKYVRFGMFKLNGAGLIPIGQVDDFIARR